MKSEDTNTIYNSSGNYAHKNVEIHNEEKLRLHEITITTATLSPSEVTIVIDPRKEKQTIYRVDLKQEIRRRAYMRLNEKSGVR